MVDIANMDLVSVVDVSSEIVAVPKIYVVLPRTTRFFAWDMLYQLNSKGLLNTSKEC
jgi:hypothetical protein